MKLCKNILTIVVIVMILALTSSNVKATGTYVLSIANSGETKNLENDQGYISKTITSIDEESGEVTVTINVSNTSVETTTTADTEIFLVVDNSLSMDYEAKDGTTRKEMVVTALNSLVNSVFSNSNNVKMGFIKFAFWGITMCDLTEKESEVLSAIDEYKNMNTESFTYTDEGLNAAYNQFSSNCNNKIVILLTDGMPSDKDLALSALQEADSEGVEVITLLTGFTTDSGDVSSTTEAEIAEVFGTEANPTTGKLYNISDSEIDTIVNTDVFNDIMSIIQSPMSNVTVTDYFPDNVLEYFDFEYVGSPSTGTVSNAIDTTTNTISWDIGTLAGNSIATLSYKLTLKDMDNEDLLNVVISTNEKVVLTYTDISSVDYTVTLTNSPKVELVEKTTGENNTNTAITDNTTATGTIPQTGANYLAVVGIVFVAVVTTTYAYKKSKAYKDIK